MHGHLSRAQNPPETGIPNGKLAGGALDTGPTLSVQEQDDLTAAVAALTEAVTGAVDEIKSETQNILHALKA